MRNLQMFSQPWVRHVAQWGAPSFIRSIQRGTISVDNVTSNTATIAAVNLAYSVLVWPGSRSTVGGTGDMNYLHTRLELTNATTVTAKVPLAYARTHLSGYEVIEFAPGMVKSIQRGVYAADTSVTATATITAVNTAKSALFWGGYSIQNANTMADSNVNCRIQMTNSTTLTVSATGSVTTTIPYHVVEFF